MAASPRHTGWRMNRASATVSCAPRAGLELRTGGDLRGDIAPFVFGVGSTDEGRIATTTIAGSAITVPDAYPFGEMIELRYTFAEAGNDQRQGLFLEVRQNAANSSTVRGAEITVAQCGAVAIGTMEGANIRAIPRSATTGNITNLYGVTGEVTFNSNAYTGTVSELAAVRGKVSMEDGATLNNASIFLAEAEPITGADTMAAIFRAQTHANITFTRAIDFTDSTLTETCGRVTLIRFAIAGTNYNLRSTACTLSVSACA